MWVVQLKFGENADKRGDYFDAHKAWLMEGFEAGVFLAAGGLEPGPGGGILAYNCSREELDQRLAKDPFLVHGVIELEVFGIDASITDARLGFLKTT